MDRKWMKLSIKKKGSTWKSISAIPSSEIQVSSLARSAGSRVAFPSAPLESCFDWGDTCSTGDAKESLLSLGDWALSSVSHLELLSRCLEIKSEMERSFKILRFHGAVLSFSSWQTSTANICQEKATWSNNDREGGQVITGFRTHGTVQVTCEESH